MDARWVELLAAGEKPSIDFKDPIAWEGDQRIKLTKDIVAMCNTRGGGSIYIGISETSGVNTLSTMTPEQVASFDPTEVSAYVNRWIEPRIQPLNIRKEEIDGNRVLTIVVPEFSDVPLVCIANSPPIDEGKNKPRSIFFGGDVLIRSDACESRKISNADEMRELLQRALSKKSDQLLVDFRRVLEGREIANPAPVNYASLHASEIRQWTESVDDWLVQKNIGNTGRVTFTFAPAQRLAPPPDNEALQWGVREARAAVGDWEFPFGSSCARLDYLEGTVDSRPYVLWQLHRSGFFGLSMTLFEDRRAETRETVHIERLLAVTLVAFMFAQRLYPALKLAADTPIEYQFELENVAGRHLDANDVPATRFTNFQNDLQTLRIKDITSPLDLRSRLDEFVISLLVRMLGAFNFRNPRPALEEQLGLFKSGWWR